MTEVGRSVVVFDVGGVLIDWDPRHLYRKLFAGDETAMEHFLANVCTHEWNRCQDAGRSFAEGARLLKRKHPQHAELIDAHDLLASLVWHRVRPPNQSGADTGPPPRSALESLRKRRSVRPVTTAQTDSLEQSPASIEALFSHLARRRLRSLAAKERQA